MWMCSATAAATAPAAIEDYEHGVAPARTEGWIAHRHCDVDDANVLANVASADVEAAGSALPWGLERQDASEMTERRAERLVVIAILLFALGKVATILWAWSHSPPLMSAI